MSWDLFVGNIKFHYSKKDVRHILWGFLYMALLGAVCGGPLGLDPLVGASCTKCAVVGALFLCSIWAALNLYMVIETGMGPELPGNPDRW